MLSAPQEKPVIEQIQENVAALQQQATAAASKANTKLLEVTGAKTNQELLGNVQNQIQTYAGQVKGELSQLLLRWLYNVAYYLGVADKIIEQITAQKATFNDQTAASAKQLSDTVAGLLGDNDPANVAQYQNSIGNVLTQANELNAQLQTQGEAAQTALLGLAGQLFEQIATSANSLVKQIDDKRAEQAQELSAAI